MEIVTLRLPHIYSRFSAIPESHNVRNMNEWTENHRHLYIGRRCRSYAIASYWQNPFRISSSCSRESSISKFKQLLEQDEEMQNELITLSGKILGCWCTPLPCHGNILISAYNDLNIYVTDSEVAISI